MNNFSAGWNKGTNQSLQVTTTEVSIIDVVCINCNKRFRSMRAVSIHLRMTAARHAVVSSVMESTIRRLVLRK